MSESIVEVLDIACEPQQPDVEAWKEKIAGIVGEFRGVLLKHNGDWFSVGFPDEDTAWAACQAIQASGEYVVGPFPADEGAP